MSSVKFRYKIITVTHMPTLCAFLSIKHMCSHNKIFIIENEGKCKLQFSESIHDYFYHFISSKACYKYYTILGELYKYGVRCFIIYHGKFPTLWGRLILLLLEQGFDVALQYNCNWILTTYESNITSNPSKILFKLPQNQIKHYTLHKFILLTLIIYYL